ncbi:glycosyltransferase [Nostocoides sp. HKS02]|uniref:glycosyltransferase n=1 Tax=Nostocoides sp. HKS02 TaxID=1813880 RepID=UPI0018A87424|nr:glycosyltransferase [Tetrasphaera sp. HKS02]
MTAVLVLHGPLTALPETLDSLARQTRSPERLVVVDPGLDGSAVETVRAHRGLSEAIPSIRFVTVERRATTGYAARVALADTSDSFAAQADSLPAVVEHVWVLTADSAAAPTTLARLVDAVRRSASVGVAGPKLLVWDQPGALRAVGHQLTRSGRVVPSPTPGEPDQGQYDRRSDVLAVPTTGMLAERSVFEGLGWRDATLGEFGSEVDFGWRAQHSGRRVVVVPRATLRTGAPVDTSAIDTSAVVPAESARRQRRAARRVALARCAWWTLPLLAFWIAVSSLLAGTALLLAKRPRAAWAELSDIGALLTPWRVARARWRSRQLRRVRRRDLVGLFVGGRTVLRHTSDLIHDQVAFEPTATDPGGRAAVQPVESGPVDDDAEDLNVLGSSIASRAARNPGLLVVIATTIVTMVASRQLGGGVLDRFRSGLVGGELLGARGDTASTWHAWLDGWHGAGLGHAGDQSPYLVVLAGLSWVVSHLPVIGAPASALGAAVAVLVGLAMPLATLTAYLGARVVTHSRWPRALAALAWGTSGVLASAVAVGRLGALVAAVLLPLVGAGCALMARRGASTTVTAATILGAAVLGAFVPALLVAVLVAGLGLIAFGPGAARVRGLALVVGPLVLLGPWVATVVASPQLLFTGPGLSVWGETQSPPWQLALLHQGGPASLPVVLGIPIVLAGVLGLVRGGPRGRGASVLGLSALVGLAYALLAPRLHLGTVPAGHPHAGAPVTAWAGTGLLLATLSLIAAALHGSRGLALTRQRGGWLAVARWPVPALVIAAVLAGAGWTTWHSLGSTLSAWTDPRPAVAIDQAEGPLANRMLVLSPDGSGLRYELVGSEPGPVARSLPTPSTERVDSSAVATAVSALFAQGAAPGVVGPARLLSDQAVGFVGLRTGGSDPRLRLLDATAGLSRLGEHDGVIFWRVLPGGGASDQAVAPSRARLVTATAQQAVPVDGSHSALSSKVVVPRGATLVLAEPRDWVRHARVSVDGRALAPAADGTAYRLPPARRP